MKYSGLCFVSFGGGMLHALTRGSISFSIWSGRLFMTKSRSMKRILIIDDEPSICKALMLGLSSGECEVDVAMDGRSGVELGAQRHYDVLIADLYLPDIDGLEVIEKIKTHSPSIVSIIITGNPSKIETTAQE